MPLMPSSRSLMIGIFFFLILPSFIWAEKYNVSNYPDPQSANPWMCGNSKPGRICDPDRPPMLTKEERNVLMAILESFPQSTKMWSTIYGGCARKGINMGIALAHNAIAENDGDFDANHNYQTYLYAIRSRSSSYSVITDMFDYIWAKIKKMEENKKDNLGATFAKKWHLLEEDGTTPNGCNRTMFIVMTADPPDVHIWSHPSVPISTSEKEAIIANHANLIVTGEYFGALDAIIANILQLILHRQYVLFAPKEESQTTVPTTVATTTTSSTTNNNKAKECEGNAIINGEAISNADSHHSFLFWFAFSMFGLFSVTALLLSIYQLRNNWQLQQFQQNQVNGGNEQIFRMKDLVKKEEKQMNSLI